MVPGALRIGRKTPVLLRILNRLEEMLIAVLMGAATIIIFLAIMQRYAAGVPALYASRAHLRFHLGAGTV